MPDLSAQMDAVCHRFEELFVRLNQPDAAADPALFRKLMRDYHETQPVVQAYRDWQTARDHLAQAKALLEEPISDPDFKQMIQQEISEKSQDVAKLENNLKILLLPRDPRDEKNVIMEIRGGAGERKPPCLPTVCCACTPCMCRAAAGRWNCSTSTRPSWAA